MKCHTYNIIRFKDESYTSNIRVKNFGNDFKNLYEFYEKNFERRCHCQFDCCGHYFSILQDIKRVGKTITLKIAYARNF
jgi:hypothetical protein